jgi:putative heme-binding domain-containing protein
MKPIAAGLAVLALSSLSLAADFELKQGDHVSIIGNTLADRMQHHGWLETLVYQKYPKHELVFRDLGFSGDEVAGFTDKPDFNHRLRSAAFGSSDDWLKKEKADVIFAFFGYNESFAGKDGLDKFKADLQAFLKHSASQKYNGTAPPRVVLFSPIAHEDLHDKNLPDGKQDNERLKLYTEAMAEVAKSAGVPFVDLFDPTLQHFAKSSKPLTFNGVHLTEYGDSVVAKMMFKGLFGAEPDTTSDPKGLEQIRQCVLDKNFTWFNRYRTVDGYSIFGGRADLHFQPDNQSNRTVAQREMEILDVMTANRDKHIWDVLKSPEAFAQKVDDSNTPDFIAVKTNKTGNGPNGEHIFLTPEEEINTMTLAKGLKINLWASEKEFPELSKPVQMSWDTKGRLWVAVWPSYPHWKPKEEMNDKILILEDTKGTGKADKCTVFADHLHCPTGFEFYNGGVIVAQAPDVMFLKDTKGTGHADYRERILSGIDSADTHHTANSFVLDPGGALYFQEGTFHHTQVETPYGPPVRCANAGVYRFEPRTFKFESYVTYGFANPHGHVFDRWGIDIVIDGTGANPYDGALFSGHLDYPAKHAGPPQVYKQRTRPCPGATYLSSRHFPESMQGTLLVANVIVPTQGILQYKISDKDSSIAGTEMETFLESKDPNFRPSDLRVGPDGAVYFLDWQNPIIGHMQHNLRDPSRDRTHGRIYRVTYEGRELLKPKAIAGEPIDKLLDLLKEPEDGTRSRARIELGSRKTEDVIAAAKAWIEKLDKKDPEYEHHMMEALWLHQNHNVVNVELLRRMLSSPEPKARAAATHVLCYWRDRVPDALGLLLKQAEDSNPRVRLEAVRAASFFTVPEAVEITLVTADHPMDPYLDFVRTETMRQLGPIFDSAVKKDTPIHFKTPLGARYLLRNISTEKLLKMERTHAVNTELLYRPAVREEIRRDAARALAKDDGISEPRVLLDAIRSFDAKKDNRDATVIFDLVHLLSMRNPADLKEVRPDLEKLALTAKQPVIRQIGYVAIINSDGSADKAWDLSVKSVSTLRDLLNAVPLISDASLRSSMYARIEPLLNALPKELQGPAGKTVMGRFVRIELPGKQRTLTLAEVEIYSDGKNIARQGKASQINTANGGEASRAIDGNKSGNFGDGGQTHTQEGVDDPWWEVDLGGEFPIATIVIYNRTEGNLGQRLNNYTLLVLDKDRKPVFERSKQPAPAVNATFEVGTDNPEQVIRRAAMFALTSVRGQEVKTFQVIAKFVKQDDSRLDAIRALQRMPRNSWPRDDASPLLEVVLDYIRKVPTSQRTTPAVLDALEFSDALASLLPADEAKKARAELSELGVRVVRISTLPERMAYDKETIAVKAGKPVEFLIENTDLMPHNFVIVQPGALEEIGTTAEADAANPAAQARHFVPASKKVLLSSVLLWPRDSQKLSFVAPKEPGVYPFVCTYPGHWRRMYGALYVVEDLDAYLANPDAYLAKANLSVKDDLLKDRRARTEWKLDDLAGAVSELKHGRSFGNGKQMFQVAGCIACHKVQGVGNEFGPDLMKLDPKKQPIDMLKQLMDPSAKIEDKYRVWNFNLKSGKAVTGMILEETKDTVKVIENPIANAQPRIIKIADIEDRDKSNVSLMPKGLVDKLTRDEILDLLAFIYSRANKDHELFKGEHEHNR